MKSIQLILLIALGSLQTYAQCLYPTFPKTGKSIQSFIPKGWQIKDSVCGDFNGDKLTDIVLVLMNTIELNDDNYDYECNRPLVILQKNREGYSLSSFSNEGILCKRCGGVFGDPYESISFKKNVLNIHHYGGSAWRWSTDFTFRFRNNQWFLIGCSNSSYWSLGDCGESVAEAAYNLSEANFNTSKAHIIKTKEAECKPYMDKIVSFPKKSLVSLRQFDVDKEYFPIKK